jgi:hypothetical protein
MILLLFVVKKKQSPNLVIHTGVTKALLIGSKTSGAWQKGGKKTNQMVTIWLPQNPSFPKRHGTTRHTLRIPIYIHLWVFLPQQVTHRCQTFLSCSVRPVFLPQLRIIHPGDLPIFTGAPRLMAPSLLVSAAHDALALSHTNLML